MLTTVIYDHINSLSPFTGISRSFCRCFFQVICLQLLKKFFRPLVFSRCQVNRRVIFRSDFKVFIRTNAIQHFLHIFWVSSFFKIVSLRYGYLGLQKHFVVLFFKLLAICRMVWFVASVDDFFDRVVDVSSRAEHIFARREGADLYGGIAKQEHESNYFTYYACFVDTRGHTSLCAMN